MTNTETSHAALAVLPPGACGSDSRPRGVHTRWAKGAALALAGTVAGLLLGTLLVALLATRVFGYELLTVRSASMQPALGPGDLIVVKPVAIEDVSEGDVVLFAAGGDAIPTVHRVAGINEVQLHVRDGASGTTEVQTEYRLVTRGDANEQPDMHEVTRSQLLGEVWFSVPKAGSVAGFPLQWLLFAFAGMSLLAWAGWERGRWRTGR